MYCYMAPFLHRWKNLISDQWIWREFWKQRRYCNTGLLLPHFLSKVRLSKNAKKYDRISKLLWHLLRTWMTIQAIGRFLPIFVAFLETLNSFKNTYLYNCYAYIYHFYNLLNMYLNIKVNSVKFFFSFPLNLSANQKCPKYSWPMQS